MQLHQFHDKKTIKKETSFVLEWWNINFHKKSAWDTQNKNSAPIAEPIFVDFTVRQKQRHRLAKKKRVCEELFW